ncbi:glycosyl transferase family 4 [Niallia circulans]|uniref:glycosyltransferase n=1 Tax=Shouchella clausii TaxID=79880 RepID=UPI000D891F1B|nr:glycosyltransferase [Shouchella clausii]SPT78313.1 glycosyl transferase family 4 [Niallia circulans]
MLSETHIIIAPTKYDDDGIKFRRHRIADKLLSRSSTNKLIWIYPEKKQGLVLENIDKNITVVGWPVKFAEAYKLRSNSLLSYVRGKIDGDCDIYLWFTFPSFPSLCELGVKKIVYDCSDNWDQPWEKFKGIKVLREKFRALSIRKAEEAIVASSSHIFATSNFLKNKIGSFSNKSIKVIENGVDDFFFLANPGTELENLPHPIVGFVGALKKKIDFNLIRYLANQNQECSFVLVGPVSSDRPEHFNELLNEKNVYYFKGVPTTKVPSIIAQLDVGLIPYKNIEYNKAVSPLKLFEYMALGIPAIGYGVPETIKYAKNNCYDYAKDYNDFNLKLKNVLENRKTYTTERINLAKSHRWSNKLDLIVDEVIFNSEQNRNKTKK